MIVPTLLNIITTQFVVLSTFWEKNGIEIFNYMPVLLVQHQVLGEPLYRLICTGENYFISYTIVNNMHCLLKTTCINCFDKYVSNIYVTLYRGC